MEEENRSHLLLWEESLDKIGEKRTSTREAGFTTINNTLKMNFSKEFVEKHKFTLVEAIKKGMKKGSLLEKKLSIEAISFVYITLAKDSLEIFKEVLPIYYEIIKDSSDDILKSVCMNSFALGSFIACDELTTIENMKFFSSFFNGNTSDIVLNSALDAWSFLLTSISKKYAYETLIPDHLVQIAEYLKKENVEIRIQAGQTIALLFEITKEIEGEDFSFESINVFIDTEELLETLTFEDSNRFLSKKDKLKQKTPFKEIRDYIENGQQKYEEIEINHQKLTFNKWEEIKQLDVFRNILGTGFQTHFQNNELLQDIFDVDINLDTRKVSMTATQKRMIQSPNSVVSKSKTKNLNKQRAARESFTDFLAQED